MSDSSAINYGVPQGSILGPILFLIYVNDLCGLKIQGCKIVAYADDTVLLSNSYSWQETVKLAEIGLEEVMSWLRNNLLTLNINKTKFITFTKSPANTQAFNSVCIKAHMCGTASSSSCSCLPLERVNSLKYLGVTLDYLLNWQEHTCLLKMRVRKLLPIFRRLRHIPTTLLKTIYFALCQALLTYCVTTWGGTYKTYLLHVERSQRAVIKVMLNKPFRFPTRELYSELKVLYASYLL